MKTLIKNSVSLYLFEDAEYIKMENNFIQIGYPPKLFISDCSISDTTLIENVTPPSDWAGCKYLFDGDAWTLNPEYVVEPQPEYVIEPLPE